MKKTISALFAILLIASILCTGVLAVSYKVTGTVTFDGKKLKSDYSNAEFTTVAQGMEPGDDVTYTITLKNDHTATTDWYMYNIAKGFEANGSARGGEYIYKLEYSGPNGRTIVDLQNITDLAASTASLKDYFLLGSLKKGEKATVTLYVKLDGETMTNEPGAATDYSNLQAQIDMRFAVQVRTDDGDVVKTGDDTVITPYLIAAGVSGLLLLLIAILRLGKSRKNRKKGGA